MKNTYKIHVKDIKSNNTKQQDGYDARKAGKTPVFFHTFIHYKTCNNATLDYTKDYTIVYKITIKCCQAMKECSGKFLLLQENSYYY